MLWAPLVVLFAVGADAEGTSCRDERIAVLYHRYREELVWLAIGMAGDIGLAEEIVQEAFAQLLVRGRGLRDSFAGGGCATSGRRPIELERTEMLPSKLPPI